MLDFIVITICNVIVLITIFRQQSINFNIECFEDYNHLNSIARKQD